MEFVSELPPVVRPKGITQTIDFPDGTRNCTACGERKPLQLFDPRKGGVLGRHAQCKPCRYRYGRKWYANNSERLQARDRVRNPQRDKARKDHLKRREQRLASFHKRRIQLQDLEHQGEFDSTITVNGLRERDGDRCRYCDISMSFDVAPAYTPQRATVEHVMPISRGGAHTWANVALACMQCNTRKNSRTPDEWVSATQ